MHNATLVFMMEAYTSIFISYLYSDKHIYLNHQLQRSGNFLLFGNVCWMVLFVYLCLDVKHRQSTHNAKLQWWKKTLYINIFTAYITMYYTRTQWIFICLVQFLGGYTMWIWITLLRFWRQILPPPSRLKGSGTLNLKMEAACISETFTQYSYPRTELASVVQHCESL